VSLLAIDLAPPACLRLDAPLRPFEPLRVLPALPRNSDCTLFIIPFFLLRVPSLPDTAYTAASSSFTSLASARNLPDALPASAHEAPPQHGVLSTSGSGSLRYTDDKRAGRSMGRQNDSEKLLEPGTA
jgi:hypothetical protein